MNRYFITALYVMAGCVVAVPLKVQIDMVPRDGIVKVISINIEAEENIENESQKVVAKSAGQSDFQIPSFVKSGALTATSVYFNSSNPIRAPELIA